MEKNFHFLMCIHFHQPVGNFDHVIEKACDRCYEPFLNAISEFKGIKFNLHFSGCLLEWFKNHKPQILTKIKKLVESDQVELLGGGFYEPILTVLPRRDAVEQIKILSGFIKDEFNARAQGAWLAERIWEPHLPEIFHESGIRYTIVDDTHLRYSGLKQNELYGYYITEENGKCLSIFPSDKTLRYSIPFHPQQETINYFRKIRDEYGKDCACYGDDGEKFGEWPGTYDWVYNKKWLIGFLAALKENSSWLKTMRITDYLDKNAPQGRVYMPTASYQEMSEWSLPADSAQRLESILNELKQNGRIDEYNDFLRGGFWRNFFVKYPESNQMHKRMILASERLCGLESGNREPKHAVSLESAKRSLFRAQCNCAYWHGVFGGLYLYHLRCAVYKNLILADKAMDSIENKDIVIDEKDFDCDGRPELIINTTSNLFTINPAEGAILTEWDIKENALNIINTLSRKKEAYHNKLKQLSLQKAVHNSPATIHDTHFSNGNSISAQLYYDRFRRSMFIDHFFSVEPSLEQAANGLYKEESDFSGALYSVIKKQDGKQPYVELERDGRIGSNPVRVIKRFTFSPRKSRMTVTYTIINNSDNSFLVNFAPELNFSLTQDDIRQELKDSCSVILRDRLENLKIDIGFSEKAGKLYRFRVCTVSQSEKDIEENYQATSLVPIFRFTLGKGAMKKIDIDVETTKS